jgi:hypothetical protein
MAALERLAAIVRVSEGEGDRMLERLFDTCLDRWYPDLVSVAVCLDGS